MARAPQSHIFATRADMLPGIERLELLRPLNYVLCDEYEEPIPPVYESLSAFDGLGQNKSGKAIGAPAFLVTPRGEATKTQPIQRVGGRPSYAVTQEGNPQSIVVSLSGLYDADTLVVGKVATISTHPEAARLYKDAVRELTAGFARIGMYSVGPDALRMLDDGKRLVTIGVRSPREFDLRRPGA